METRNEDYHVGRTGFRAVPPGEILREELRERGIKQKDFAKMVGMQESHLSELIKGNRKVTMEVANKLEDVLGISAVTWVNMQTQYDYDFRVITQRNKEEQQAVKEESSYSEIVNLNELYKRLSIVFTDRRSRVNELIKRLSFDLLDMQKWELQIQGYFKRSEKLQIDEKNLRTWLLLALIAAKETSIPVPYKEGNAFKAAKEIATMANGGTLTVKKIEECLGRFGIAYVKVDKLEKTPVDAFSTLVNDNPVIVVTYRYNDMDRLAFDILHELYHIERHIGQGCNYFISIEGNSSDSIMEKEANRFAQDMLIPPEIWDDILRAESKNLSPHMVINAVAKRAANHGVSMSIAVSRYKHDSNFYKVKKYMSPKIILT